ncbi:cyclin-A2-4-like [Gossypium australe]|uniref:Cyclin-A2-4-like n=1 Tax=Gossypium australe TaxID=47621 RepID=A0A5B6UBZ8_9ROSI|nr:cyclin-A2-4-like [Gossypium australe]
MRKENGVSANVGALNGRITRARAATLRASGQLPLLNAPKQPDQKRVSRANTKRSALDENHNAGLQHKKRAVLQDVTNVCCNNSYKSCINATKIQAKSNKQARKGAANSSKVAPDVAAQVQPTRANLQKEDTQELAKIEPKLEVTCSVNLKEDATLPLNSINEGVFYRWLSNRSSAMPSQSQSRPRRNALKIRKGRVRNVDVHLLDNRKPFSRGKFNFSGTSITPSDPDFVDIDSDKKDPQLCSLYSPEIYNNLRVAELLRRPYPNFMETIQRDITQSMRGILVDWLVEVSEEYKLVPDTLYLTVHLIDWFLSKNYIERQRLQLLGITCMLIASKYEEICAPRVEEFCFITDNTYTKEEVLKMETKVLKYFGFQIFAPTAKTFLRRFLRAAQASYKSPSIEMEYLANYLAELSLIDYEFLNFVPSIVAASAVFLARWTLDQSSHPWNSTLEHYTAYNQSDLKTTVIALQDLQLNTKGCPLTAIRMKYRQQKFKSVAALRSPKLLETLF